MPSLPLPFRIKICGVTSTEDALMISRAGADAIGLNFYPGSKRFIDASVAQAIAAITPPGVAKVGVFVNSSPKEIREIAAQATLDIIQLHGDEPADMLAELSELAVIRALRWGPDGSTTVEKFLDRCSQINVFPRALLIDAYHQTGYGGTGITADWNAIKNWKERNALDLPIILAGGLNPTNVEVAITTVKPSAVDTASGVESSPRRKDPKLSQDFVNKSKHAFTIS